jgi:hypothetical protein
MPSSQVPWEAGCGPADPALSANFGSYTGSGYNPVRRGSGEVGTINAGANTPVTPNPPRAQLRFYVGADGNLYALDNLTGKAWVMSPTTNVPQPASES